MSKSAVMIIFRTQIPMVIFSHQKARKLCRTIGVMSKGLKNSPKKANLTLMVMMTMIMMVIKMDWNMPKMLNPWINNSTNKKIIVPPDESTYHLEEFILGGGRDSWVIISIEDRKVSLLGHANSKIQAKGISIAQMMKY